MTRRIIYIGPNSGTSRHRALALERLGHQVAVVDPRKFISASRAVDYWAHHTGALFLSPAISSGLLRAIPSGNFDLVWVDGGHMIAPSLVAELKRRYGLIINYNIDDPFGGRDGKKWRLYLKAVPLYDLVVVVRACNIREARSAGARRVQRVYMSADEIAHAPREVSDSDRKRWASEVAFVGTWMPERGPLLARLIELGVPLSIFGDRWHKAKEEARLRPYWRGPHIHNDADYAKAIQCAKVCLGLLSKGNRDQSTTRSFEVPSLGGVLCAERTPEHMELYREDQEAVFWSTPEECAEKCQRLLHDDDFRNYLAANGRARCLDNRTTNEHLLANIIAYALRSGIDTQKCDLADVHT